MRELLRSKACANMRAKGYTQINKPRRSPNGGYIGSFFAQNWRNFSKNATFA